MSDRQFAIAVLIVAALGLAALIALYVRQSNMDDACKTSCDPYRHRVMSDGCYCRTATGWERHREDE